MRLFDVLYLFYQLEPDIPDMKYQFNGSAIEKSANCQKDLSGFSSDKFGICPILRTLCRYLHEISFIWEARKSFYFRPWRRYCRKWARILNWPAKDGGCHWNRYQKGQVLPARPWDWSRGEIPGCQWGAMLRCYLCWTRGRTCLRLLLTICWVESCRILVFWEGGRRQRSAQSR